MKTSKKSTKKTMKYFALVLILVLLGAVGAVIWKFYGEGRLPSAQAIAFEETEDYQTSVVQRGDVSLTISGSGTVVTDRSVELAFSVNGVISELNVQPGDQVSKGQVLAVLDNLKELEQSIRNAELTVQIAQSKLENLTMNGESAIAQALVEKTNAQTAYEEAQKNLHQKGDSRCAPYLTQDYYFAYLYAQQRVDEWEGYLNDPETGYGKDYILKNLTPLRKTRDQAYINWIYCQSYTEAEIQSSQAALQLAIANQDQATETYQSLVENGGIDVRQAEIASASLNNARLQLIQAQQDFNGAAIIAPIDGTVMEINGKMGQKAGTGVLIVLADLEHPLIKVYFDESDLENFAAGCTAQVIFDSLDGQIFSGLVTQVLPTLGAGSIENLGLVQGLVELNDSPTSSGKVLPPGLSASVEVTCHQANDVLLVTAQALYESRDHLVYVYVLNDQGLPEKREIEIGINTVANVEVIRGLDEGERVITSAVESNQGN